MIAHNQTSAQQLLYRREWLQERLARGMATDAQCEELDKIDADLIRLIVQGSRVDSCRRPGLAAGKGKVTG